jgi:hypothetical protein
MKTFLYLSLLLSLAAAHVDRPPGLYVSIISTRSERSEDSNSTHTTITLDGDRLVYDETHHGFHAGPPVHKERTLTPQEVDELTRFIRERNLLRSGTSTYPPGNVPYTLYELKVEIRWRGKRSRLQVSGPTNSDAMTNSRLYKGTDELVEEMTVLANKD